MECCVQTSALYVVFPQTVITDKIYSTFIQEPQAEKALIEVAETMFQESLNTEPNQTEEEVKASI